jgi:hypothetical protein
MVTWQSTQFSLPWTDFAKIAERTPIHTGAWPFLSGLNSASWQSRHSVFGTAGGLAGAAGLPAPKADAASNKNNPVSLRADRVKTGDENFTLLETI